MIEMRLHHSATDLRCSREKSVTKPELILESKPEHNFVRARCSLCPRVWFNLVGNTLAEKVMVRQMFDIHAREVHGQTKQVTDQTLNSARKPTKLF
jgi:hypothetical protein